MEFNIWVTVVFIGMWLGQIVLSILEDTFYFYDKGNKELDLPLSRHWGVLIGDPILAIMNGFMYPYLGPGWHSLFLLLTSILISWQLHKSWWSIRGHIFPDNNESTRLAMVGWESMTSTERVDADPKKYWRHDLSEAGWAHMLFFILQLEFIFEFITTPMPEIAVKTITGFLLVFAPFAVFQPGWAEWSKKRLRDPKATWFWRSFFSLIIMWAAILVVYYFKT